MQSHNGLTTGESGISEFAKLSAEIHNIIGTRYADEENYSEALENFTKAIELNPKDEAAYFNRGTVKIEMGDFSGGNIDLRTSYKLSASKPTQH